MTPTDELPPGLRAFIDEDVALLPVGLTERERARLIDELTTRRDTQRLVRLGDSPDKALAKAARKAMQLLRTRGASADAAAARVYRVVGPYAEEQIPSYASIVDGRGERVLWFVEAADRGYSVFEVELSETAGIQSLTALDLTRKAWRDQVAHMRRSERALVGEVPGGHARVLIERAYRGMRAERRSPPEGFAQFHLRLQASDEELLAPHPLRQGLGEATASEGELAAVLERPELSLFVPTREAVGVLDAAIGEVATDELVLEPAQKLARVEAAIRRVADETLGVEARAQLSGRLLELGLIILSRQADEAGRAAARACLVAADRALDPGVVASAHPTLVGMYRRLVPASLLLELAEPTGA